jgi:hypothetical protein
MEHARHEIFVVLFFLLSYKMAEYNVLLYYYINNYILYFDTYKYTCIDEI